MAASVSENHVCSHRHSCALDNFFRKLIQSPHRILSPFLCNGDTAIDLGCGPGFFTLPMAELAVIERPKRKGGFSALLCVQ
ncbi:MAG: hypothetical protein KJN87_09895 [Desulfofustis sp.]|nr:hypothetical protein [Desulfofustis sp.]NNK56957.1 hypothetical protein [Desulfofustis sp.]